MSMSNLAYARCAYKSFWPSSTEAAIPPNRLYLIVKKDLLASPSSASIWV